MIVIISRLLTSLSKCLTPSNFVALSSEYTVYTDISKVIFKKKFFILSKSQSICTLENKSE